MEKRMEEKTNEVKTDVLVDDLKYKATVPCNNSVMLEAKKKQRKIYGIMCLVCAIPFVIMTIASAVGENSSVTIVALFACFVLLCVGCSVFFFCTAKASKKDEVRSITYSFHEDYLEVNQDDSNKKSHKTLTKCLYRSYKNKQYVSKVFEFPNRFEFRIFTGTYNGAPQYKKYVLPKDILKSEEIESFKEFLKKNLDKDYVIKQK